jgi:hypothetical protein
LIFDSNGNICQQGNIYYLTIHLDGTFYGIISIGFRNKINIAFDEACLNY